MTELNIGLGVMQSLDLQCLLCGLYHSIHEQSNVNGTFCSITNYYSIAAVTGCLCGSALSSLMAVGNIIYKDEMMWEYKPISATVTDNTCPVIPKFNSSHLTKCIILQQNMITGQTV